MGEVAESRSLRHTTCPRLLMLVCLCLRLARVVAVPCFLALKSLKMVRILAAALLGGAAAFAPSARPATRPVAVVFAGEDYASMDGPALAAAIDGKRKELFDMRLENRA